MNMDHEIESNIKDTIDDLRRADEKNPISNAFMIAFQNRMSECLTELVNQIKTTNSILEIIDCRLEAIESNTGERK